MGMLRRFTWCLFLLLLITGMGLFGMGCNRSSSSSDSKNDAAEQESEDNHSSSSGNSTQERAPSPVLVAWGDSLTTGIALPGRTPYPERVALITGMQVINAGVSGESACAGAKRASSVTRHSPRAVFILFGTNDVIAGHDLANSKECIRSMIRAAIGIGARPIVGTIPPMLGPMDHLNKRVDRMNRLIQEVAREERCRLVDLHRQFGDGSGLLLEDGFHPNEVGTQLIAFAFAESL